MQLDDKCGASVAAAFPCPGMENITVGVVPAINFSTKKLNAAFSIGGGDKTFQLALCGWVMHSCGNDPCHEECVTCPYAADATFRLTPPLSCVVEWQTWVHHAKRHRLR